MSFLLRLINNLRIFGCYHQFCSLIYTMDIISIKPLSPYDFIEKVKTTRFEDIDWYTEYFATSIQAIAEVSVGPYFWFIPDNYLGKIVFISESCRELTPYTQEEWLNPADPPMQLASIIYPDDRGFVFSAIQFSNDIAQQFHKSGKSIKSNIYARFLNAKNEYRWMMIQSPKYFFNENGDCQSSLVVFTDISHLHPNINPMMTVMSSQVGEKQLFRVIPETRKMLSVEIPPLSKREKQIIKLMASGLSTPQISEELKIAYNTVQNHKRNLRAKTNTKTAAELISFVLRNHLI